jgi:hypothetical protein
MIQINNLHATVGPAQILPGTGRGTSEAGGGAGEAACAVATLHQMKTCSSTTLRVVPLPRWGRI